MIGVLSLAVSAGGAPPHTDFSGVYDLNGGRTGRVTIDQSTSDITIIRMLDGRENTNHVQLDGKVGACITPDWQPSTCRVQWNGDALVIHFFSRQATTPRQPPIEIHTSERLSLSKNQQILSIRIEVDAPLNPNSTAAPQPLQMETYTRE